MKIDLPCGCEITINKVVNLNHIEWFTDIKYSSKFCEKHDKELTDKCYADFFVDHKKRCIETEELVKEFLYNKPQKET